MNLKALLYLSLVLAALLNSTTSLHAQKKAPSAGFSLVTWEALSYEPIYYRQGEDYIPIKLMPGNRSDLFELKGMTSLGLYVAEESEEGEQTYKLVGKTSIPQGISRILFFITERDDPGKLPLRLSGIDDSLLTFPRGACRFVNLTNVPLAVRFADKTSLIKAKDMTVLESKVEASGGLLPFIVFDRKGTNLYENRYFAQQIGRDMIFILPPKRQGGRVNIKLLPQLVPREPEEKKVN